MRAMVRYGLVAVMLVVPGTAVGDPASAGRLTVVELPPLPMDRGASPTAMNDSGEVVGISVGTTTWRPVRWDRDGRVTGLPTFDDRGGSATDINNAGVAVGASQTADGSAHAVLWRRDGTLVDLGAHYPRLNSYAGAINDLGMVVGHVNGRAALWYPSGRHVELPSPPSASWTLAEGITDDDTVIIGRMFLPEIGFLVPVRWDGKDHRLTLLPTYAHLLDVAASGWVAGSSIPPGGQESTGTVWNHYGRIVAVGNLPGGGISWAAAVNRHGTAVGLGSLPGVGVRALRWDRFGHIAELSGPADADYVTATDIADDGTAVGYAGRGGWPAERALRWDGFGNVTELGTLPGTLGSTTIAVNNRRMVLGVAVDGVSYPRAVLWR